MPRASASELSPGGLPVPVGCPVPVLSCLFSPGGLLIPPKYPREILGGGVERVPAVGVGPRGPRPRPRRRPAMASRAPSSAMASELSVPLWRSPSCVPVRVCLEGPPELPPPLPDGTVKARDEPSGRGELCQGSVVCHVFPPLVSIFGLFPVLV